MFTADELQQKLSVVGDHACSVFADGSDVSQNRRTSGTISLRNPSRNRRTSRSRLIPAVGST